jgi:hypothetical protein
MKKSLLFCLLSAALSAQESSHDAPLELTNGTVHAFFRTDTLIDRRLAQTAFGQTANQIFQHTHRFGHTVRVSMAGLPDILLPMSATEQLHFQLSGNRGFITVVPQEKAGIGGLVAGHAAQAGGGPAVGIPSDGLPLERQKVLIKGGSAALTGKLQKSDRHSIDTVWVVQAPTGYSWVPQQSKTEAIVGAEIAATAKHPNHKIAKANARRIEYRLKDSSNQTNFFMERLFISNNGNRVGSGLCLPPDARVVICENEYNPVTKKPVAVCPAGPGNRL